MATMHDRTIRGNKSNTRWIWWGIISALFVIWLLSKMFSGSTNDKGSEFLNVTPFADSTVYISMSSASKARISQVEKLYATDKSVSVQVGWARAENKDLSIDIDKTTELAYKSHTESGNTLAITKWRAWISTIGGSTKTELKFMSTVTEPWSIILVEQNNLSSTAYMISWSATIQTKNGSTILEAWKRIMIAGSDLSNPNGNLDALIGVIDESIASEELFIRNNGAELLKSTTAKKTSSWETISLGATGDLLPLTSPGKYIELTDPLDGVLIKNSTFAVMGNILSPEVKKVTINDTTATLSPVNGTFVLQNIPATSEIINIVYKAYAQNWSLLERSVISVFASKWTVAQVSSRLLPDNSPISNKDYPITFPTENPYKTTESLVRVEWTVPKDAIKYIMVNDYRLQKFLSWGGKWYYFANTQTETMKEGINLYTIRFYWLDDSLVYTQVFTIVKESKNANTVSGENQ